MEPNLDRRCNWCDGIMIFHSPRLKWWHGLLTRWAKIDATYVVKPDQNLRKSDRLVQP